MNNNLNNINKHNNPFKKISHALRIINIEKNIFNFYENAIISSDEKLLNVFVKKIITNLNKSKVLWFKFHFKYNPLDIDEKITFKINKNSENLDDFFNEIDIFINKKFEKYEKKNLILKYIKINIVRLFEPEKYKYPYTNLEKEDHKKWVESIPF